MPDGLAEEADMGREPRIPAQPDRRRTTEPQ
jgi:hypothetical protein